MSRLTLTDSRNKHEISKHDRYWDWLYLLAFLLAALIIFGFNLGELPLRDWDEGTIAQVAREIYRSNPDSNHWLYPTLGEQPYLNKPPLIHIIIAAVYSLFGISEWTTRLPTAMLTALSVPLIYCVGREIFLSRTPVIFSTLVYLTLLPVTRHGRLAMLDGSLVCFYLLFVWFILLSRKDLRACVGVAVSLGLVCLTKGIMIGLLLGAIAILFLYWDTPTLLKSKYFWSTIVFGIIPVVIWYLCQFWHYGRQFLSTNLVDDTFSRIWTSVGQQTGPPWYYLLEITKYAWPWLLFFPSALRLAWQHRNLSWAKLVLLWSGFYLLAISIMTTKLPWYVFPFYPALAMAVGAYLSYLWQTPNRSYPRTWIAILTLLSIVAWIGSIYFGFLAVDRQADIQFTLAATALTLTIATIFLIRQSRYFIVILFAGLYCSLLLFFSSNNWVWELAEAYPVKPVAAAIERSIPAKQVIYTTFAYNRPSLDFYSDRSIISLSLQEITKYWSKKDDIYLLIESNKLQQLKLKNARIIDNVMGWQLVGKTNKFTLKNL